MSKVSIRDRQFNKVGNIAVALTNYGRMADDLFWPSSSNHNYSWGSHIIIGGIVEDTGDTLISSGSVPGERFSTSEFAPGRNIEDEETNAARIYLSSIDGDEWPIKDEYDINRILSSEDTFTEFNDLNPDHHGAFSPGALGIVVKQRTMLWDILEYTNAILFEYTIVNVSESNLKDVFFAVFADPDIDRGWDDKIEYDSENEIILVRDVDGVSDRSSDSWVTGTIAYSFLEVPGHGSESLVNSVYMGNNRSLYPNSESGWFLLGDANDYNRLTSNYIEPDSTVFSDVGFYLSSNTFDVDAGDSVRVIFSMAISDFEDVITITKDLKKSVQIGWVFPGPPPSPKLTVYPGDEKITLSWSSDPIKSIDRFSEITENPDYKAQDFQGFRVYKKELWRESEWELLKQYDLIDNRSAARFGIQIGETGIPFTYVDTEVVNGFEYEYSVTSFDINLDTLSFESSINENSTTVVPRTDPSDVILPQTSIEHISGTANVLRKFDLIVVDPSQVKNATYNVIFKEAFNAPERITGHSFPVYRFDIIGADGDTVLKDQEILTNTKGVPVSGTSAIFDGLLISYELSLHDSTWWIDAFVIEDDKDEQFDGTLFIGGISKGLRLRLIDNASLYFRAAWAFTGNDYKIEWISLPGDSLTLRVFDTSNDVEILYSDVEGYSWSFLVGNRKAKVISFDTEVGQRYPIGFYLSGAIFMFNIDNSVTSPPTDGDSWIVLTSGHRGLHNGNIFQIKTEALSFGSEISSIVTVVPNPYFVRNILEQGYSSRRIQFTNLPSVATIRVFTVSGDLVKTIVHNGSNIISGAGGTAEWNLLSNNGLRVASGMYFFHIESKSGNQIGKFAVIQ